MRTPRVNATRSALVLIGVLSVVVAAGAQAPQAPVASAAEGRRGDALRALLDPATREEAVIDIDLSGLMVSIPAASLHHVLARLIPDGRAEFGDAGLTVHPGDGSPGVRISFPAAGVCMRLGTDGLRIGSE